MLMNRFKESKRSAQTVCIWQNLENTETEKLLVFYPRDSVSDWGKRVQKTPAMGRTQICEEDASIFSGSQSS